ncbi:MAG: tRNA pseudouridine(55) synthase TruB [Gemmatimonadaceae bacterium]
MSRSRKLPYRRVDRTTTEPTDRSSTSVEGLLLVDKPAGMTSHDVVQQVRRIYGERSIGHLGTLDPFATGLLVLLLGRATRLATFIDTEPKVYEAAIKFGEETDTDDTTGTVIRSAQPPRESDVVNAVTSLVGKISQIPPAYSAKSIDGVRAYDAARRGAPLDLAPVEVTIFNWRISPLVDDILPSVITCSGGTYIRALARDLGRLVSSAAHLRSLRRIRVGPFDIRDAATLETLADDPNRVKRLRVVADA